MKEPKKIEPQLIPGTDKFARHVMDCFQMFFKALEDELGEDTAMEHVAFCITVNAPNPSYYLLQFGKQDNLTRCMAGGINHLSEQHMQESGFNKMYSLTQVMNGVLRNLDIKMEQS